VDAAHFAAKPASDTALELSVP